MEFPIRLSSVELNELSVAVRIVLAILCGGVLGLERTRKHRAAGLRTYMLVCIGAAVVMMIGPFMAQHFGATDMTRMPAQVISGIGFLGVGTIMVTRYYRVKGLTTAAGLWVTACMGLAIGIGFYFGALLTCAAVIVVMMFADRFETMFTRRIRRIHLYIIFRSIEELKPFLTALRADGLIVSDIETLRSDGNQGVGLFCLIKFPRPITREEAFLSVEQADGVLFVEEIDD
jgi:putative Mg2+ transporter-C (MgtC) family protein